MKQILKIIANIYKFVMLYIILPFFISTSIITLFDVLGMFTASSSPTMSSLYQIKNIRMVNLLDSIFKANILNLFLIVGAVIIVTKSMFTLRQIKKINLEDVIYISSNKNFKDDFNSSYFCYLRI